MKALMATVTMVFVALASAGCGGSHNHARYGDSQYQNTQNRDYGRTVVSHDPVPPPPAGPGYFRDYYRGGFEQRNIEREGWVLLGSRTVDFKKDGDTIMVDRGERYGQLRLVVAGAPIEMYKMNVYFRNGDKFPVETRSIFQENSQTRAIDLPGGGRDIRKVTFLYRSLDKYEGKATVYLFAR